MELRIKDWNKFQHFRDRKPPWIKLYRDILDDVRWHELDPKAAKVLVMCWLLASENDGYLPDMKTISFRLRVDIEEISQVITLLEPWLEHVDITGDIDVISLARSRETETERETEKRERHSAPPESPRKRGGDYAPDFEEFWAVWPNRPRKVAKSKCAEKWTRNKLFQIHRTIIDHVARMCTTQQWKDGYEPAPLTYLNQRRWEDPIPADGPKPKGNGGAWWTDLRSMQAKARELGMSYPEGRTGESAAEFKGRIQAAIDKGGHT